MLTEVCSEPGIDQIERSADGKRVAEKTGPGREAKERKQNASTGYQLFRFPTAPFRARTSRERDAARPG